MIFFAYFLLFGLLCFVVTLFFFSCASSSFSLSLLLLLSHDSIYFLRIRFSVHRHCSFRLYSVFTGNFMQCVCVCLSTQSVLLAMLFHFSQRFSRRLRNCVSLWVCVLHSRTYGRAGSSYICIIFTRRIFASLPTSSSSFSFLLLRLFVHSFVSFRLFCSFTSNTLGRPALCVCMRVRAFRSMLLFDTLEKFIFT